MGIVVAVDGPSGAGKSSTSRAVAARAKWNYLDTGALYRAATWLAQREKVSEPGEIVEALRQFPLRFETDPERPKVFCGDVDISDAIRSQSITDEVSQVSAHPEVRQHLLELQHKLISRATHGIVVEGRDIGTVVAPEAALKIFLTADLAARAERREKEIDSPSQVL